MESVDLNTTADDGEIARISELYTSYLHRCKDECGLHYVQPGRFVLPGELAGAPVVQFFPVVGDMPEKPEEGSYYARLKQRYDYYCQHVVKKFYREYFSSFDRQIVLVDALQPLNQGMDVFGDMRQHCRSLLRVSTTVETACSNACSPLALTSCCLRQPRQTMSPRTNMRIWSRC